MTVEQLITDNVRLAAWCAQRIHRGYARQVCDVDDLVSEAQLALVDCARRFDPNAGTKFSTYAVSYIEGKLKGYVDATHRGGRYQAKLVREGKQQEISEVGLTLTASKSGEEIERPIADMRATPEQRLLDAAEESGALSFATESLLESAGLEERELGWLRRKASGETLDKIGKSVGISCERVRQIVDRAIEKIRAAKERIEKQRGPAPTPTEWGWLIEELRDVSRQSFMFPIPNGERGDKRAYCNRVREILGQNKATMHFRWSVRPFGRRVRIARIGKFDDWKHIEPREWHEGCCLYCDAQLSTYQQVLFCSSACSNRFFSDTRKKITERDLRRYYVDQRLPLTQVAAKLKCNAGSVHAALRRYGIPTRKYTDKHVCIEPGCDKPVVKFENKTNGRITGTRCERHLKLKRAEWSTRYRARKAAALAVAA